MWVNLGDKYAGQGGGAQGVTSARAGRANTTEQHRGGKVTGAPSKSLIGLPWRYALACIDELGLILRAEVIWNKPNGLPESVTDRVRRSHEQWFHFVKQPLYFAAVDEIREPTNIGNRPVQSWAERRAAGNLTHAPDNGHSTGVGMTPNPLGKLPGSVWTIASQPLIVPKELGIDHFAAFPMEWPRRIILGWSPPDGVVLDPFGGTGTTALVASVLGRRGISVDMSADYCRLAQWRTTDPKQLERAQRPAKLRTQPPPPATPRTAAEWLEHFALQEPA
jgi:site-specific DNA-methyltransferase (cytosine-N4-specific)